MLHCSWVAGERSGGDQLGSQVVQVSKTVQVGTGSRQMCVPADACEVGDDGEEDGCHLGTEGIVFCDTGHEIRVSASISKFCWNEGVLICLYTVCGCVCV